MNLEQILCLYEEKVFGERLENVEYKDRVGVYGIVINNEEKVAVIKTQTGYFLPGGGLENRESHEECVKREFLEETGYEADVIDFIGKASLYHLAKNGQHLHGIGYFYIVELNGKTGIKVEDDHDLIWMEPEKCAELLFLENQAWAVLKATRLL